MDEVAARYPAIHNLMMSMNTPDSMAVAAESKRV